MCNLTIKVGRMLMVRRQKEVHQEMAVTSKHVPDLLRICATSMRGTALYMNEAHMGVHENHVSQSANAPTHRYNSSITSV